MSLAERAPPTLVDEAEVLLPKPFLDLFRSARHKAYYGGRGSAKSHSFGRALLASTTMTPLRVICGREIQDSIRESVKRLLDDLIWQMNLIADNGQPFFRSTDREIVGANDSLFIFKGLRTNADSIRSLEGFDVAWLEEANRVSLRSLELLIPTLRSDHSEIWYGWNPESPKDPVDNMFRDPDRGGIPRTPETGAPPRSIIHRVSYKDNIFFPRVLKEEMEADRKRDPDKFAHVWLGSYRSRSEARVFRNWRSDTFSEPPIGTRFFFGADWGFSIDPSVLLRMWFWGPRTLMIDYEAWAIGVEIDHLPALFAGTDTHSPPRWPNPKPYSPLTGEGWKGIPGATRWTIRADSARPDTISYMRNRGFQIQSAAKGPGSVEDGIEFMQSFDIVVHERCTHVIEELSTYSWKVDLHTEEILPVLADKNNHTIDSARYGLEGARRGGGSSGTVLGLY